MIKQLSMTTVTGTTTLTYAQLGDIVANASGAIDLTLPNPLPGLWYRITNNTANTVTVKTSGATLASIAQNEFVLCLANGTSGWFFAKSGGQLTKAAIEAVLTGEITSHTHAYAPSPIISSSAPTTSTTGVLGQLYIETATPTVYYCSAIAGSDYTWNELSGGSSYTLPMATESTLGGIKAAERTSETQEVKIDPSSGKLYTAAPDEAENGLPAGGTAGQILYKYSNTDYDTYWDDPPAGGGGETIWGGM